MSTPKYKIDDIVIIQNCDDSPQQGRIVDAFMDQDKWIYEVEIKVFHKRIRNVDFGTESSSVKYETSIDVQQKNIIKKLK